MGDDDADDDDDDDGGGDDDDDDDDCVSIDAEGGSKTALLSQALLSPGSPTPADTAVSPTTGDGLLHIALIAAGCTSDGC